MTSLTRKTHKKGTSAERTKGISLTERNTMQFAIESLAKRLTILETNNIYLNKRVAQFLNAESE